MGSDDPTDCVRALKEASSERCYKTWIAAAFKLPGEQLTAVIEVLGRLFTLHGEA